MRLIAVIAALLYLAVAPAAHADEATPDDTARMLAGLKPSSGSPLEKLTEEAGWKSHSKYFNEAWARLEERQLAKIGAWTEKHVVNRRPVLFYMFSGPDFLYANAFFKDASTYILAGLEPVGDLPDLTQLSPRAIGQELRELQGSLNSVLSFSFFITKKMKTELNSGKLKGTVPVLYTFIARSGKTIRSAELVVLKSDGTVVPQKENENEKGNQGVKIEFADGPNSKVQTLYYFSTDISDDGLKRSGFLKYLEAQGPGDAFVKSASYLMHSDSFSVIRNFLVAHTSTLVQDDSGIPVRFLDAKDWQLTGFGTYLQPLGIFPNTYQPKLKELFAKGKAKPLDFGVGYRWRPNESNLLLAVHTARSSEKAP